jgi:hypothetical protein
MANPMFSFSPHAPLRTSHAPSYKATNDAKKKSRTNCPISGPYLVLTGMGSACPRKDLSKLARGSKLHGGDTWSNDGVTHPEHVCGYQLGLFVELNVRRAAILVEEFESGNVVNRREFELKGRFS